MNKKKQKLLKKITTILEVILILAIITTLLVYFISHNNKNNLSKNNKYNVIIDGNTNISLTKLEPIDNNEDIIPYSNLSNYSGSIYVSSFTVKGEEKNKKDINILYDVALISKNVDSAILNKYLKWELIKNEEIIANGNFSDFNTDKRFILTNKKQHLPRYKDNSDYLQIIIWISNNFKEEFEKETMLNKNFSCTIDVKLYSKKNK